jgi:cytochrome P450
VELKAHNFKDPDQFKPERWLGVTHDEPHNLEAFIPFSYGLGVCIGKQIALQNMKSVVPSRLVQNSLLMITPLS